MANHYVRSGAAGANDGSNWTDAWDDMPTTLTRGDTYYVADGTYAGYTFDDAVDGTTLITIKKATTTSHGTETGWLSIYGDGVATFAASVFATSYYLLDGVVGGGPGSWKTGHGFEITAASSGNQLILFNNQPDNIEVRHINIHFPDRNNFNACIYGVNNGATHSNNITFAYCWIHEVWGTHFTIRYWEDFLMEYCYLQRNKSTSAYHAESISTHGGLRHIIRYNVFEDIHGSGWYINLYDDSDACEFYGNVFWETGDDEYDPDDALVNNPIGGSQTETAKCTNWKIYNNTVCNIPYKKNSSYSGLGDCYTSSSTGNVSYNNLWYEASWIMQRNCTEDYGWSIDSLEQSGQLGPHTITGATGDPFVDWVNGDFRLKAHSVAGTDVGSSPYNVDAFGTVRSNWDRGAYEYVDALSIKTSIRMRF